MRLSAVIIISSLLFIGKTSFSSATENGNNTDEKASFIKTAGNKFTNETEIVWEEVCKYKNVSKTFLISKNDL